MSKLKEMERRELEVLAKICNNNNIQLKLAKDLLKTSKRLSYENYSTGARTKEYEEIIRIYTK